MNRGFSGIFILMLVSTQRFNILQPGHHQVAIVWLTGYRLIIVIFCSRDTSFCFFFIPAELNYYFTT